jgi:hypothetical protein
VQKEAETNGSHIQYPIIFFGSTEVYRRYPSHNLDYCSIVSNSMNPKNKHLPSNSKPILIVDHLTEHFGNPMQNRSENEIKTNKNEELLLTLIANVIVEILLKEEL